MNFNGKLVSNNNASPIRNYKRNGMIFITGNTNAQSFLFVRDSRIAGYIFNEIAYTTIKSENFSPHIMKFLFASSCKMVLLNRADRTEL